MHVQTIKTVKTNGSPRRPGRVHRHGRGGATGQPNRCHPRLDRGALPPAGPTNTSSPDTYRCAPNGFYLYKRSPTSSSASRKEPAAVASATRAEGLQFYASKKWTLRADVSLTWDGDGRPDRAGRGGRQPQAEPATRCGKAANGAGPGRHAGRRRRDQQLRRRGEQVGWQQHQRRTREEDRRRSASPTRPTSHDAAPARDAESSDDEADAESATARGELATSGKSSHRRRPRPPQRQGEALDNAPAKNANNGKPRAGAKPRRRRTSRGTAPRRRPSPSQRPDAPAAKAPPPPNVAQDAPPRRPPTAISRRRPAFSKDKPPTARPSPPRRIQRRRRAASSHRTRRPSRIE